MSGAERWTLLEQDGPRGIGARYLDLLEQVLTGTIVEDPPIINARYLAFLQTMAEAVFGDAARVSPELLGYQPGLRAVGWDWPSRALTMVGSKRLHDFRLRIEDVIARAVPGDIVEAGVWRGGASILARAVLCAHGVADRRVILADSFAGLPPPDAARFPADAGSDLHLCPELAIPSAEVAANFTKFGLLDQQVLFVEGWFRDTMPGFPAERIAVLRLDGDMYESTIDPLIHLYDRVMEGGWVIVDDYGIVPACRQAVHDFFDTRGIAPKLTDIDGIGMAFAKT